ncbi:MAG TPA: hypothetical protein VMP68_27230, partial [Candidatus Eisenbacteria bacterium]|nr:hypothetical protein [Candidatus Eisenbacteria bacterium]
MYRVHSGSGLLLSVLLLAIGIVAQDSPSTSGAPIDTKSTTPAPKPQTAEGTTSGTLTLDRVLDRVVEREHMFMAQMRHLHPMVETYLQDLKTDGSGNTSPVKDQY